MKKALIASVVLLGIAILLSAAGIAALIWSAGRSLDQREAWIEAELQIRSAHAAALQDFDWPPYRDHLKSLRSDGGKDLRCKAILDWRAAGCPMTEESAAADVGFDNRHWPFIFGVPRADVRFFLRTAPLAQDLYRGSGFGSSLFRTAEECSLMCRWRALLETQLLTAEDLDQCVTMVDRLERVRPSFRDEVEVEHLLRCRDVIRIYRTSKDPERLIVSQKPGWRSLFSRAVLFSQFLRGLEDQREWCLELESLPPPERRSRLEAEGFPEAPRNFLTFAYVERGILWKEARSIQRRQLLRTALAIARYGAETGTHPEQLQDLVPKYLSSVPRSPLTGAPLVYGAGRVRADVEDNNLEHWTVKAPAGAR